MFFASDRNAFPNLKPPYSEAPPRNHHLLDVHTVSPSKSVAQMPGHSVIPDIPGYPLQDEGIKHHLSDKVASLCGLSGTKSVHFDVKSSTETVS